MTTLAVKLRIPSSAMNIVPNPKSGSPKESFALRIASIKAPIGMSGMY